MEDTNQQQSTALYSKEEKIKLAINGFIVAVAVMIGILGAMQVSNPKNA